MATFTGTSGDDTITPTLVSPGVIASGATAPTAGADTLDGGAGNDTLAGGGGADRILGGEGDDLVLYNVLGLTNDGADVIDGGTGNDTLTITDPTLFNATLNVSGGRVVFADSVFVPPVSIDNVETLNLRISGGTNILSVADLNTTDVRQLTIDFSSTSGTPDASPDRVTLAATANADTITAAFSADGTGLHATLGLVSTDILGVNAADQVSFNLGAGGDVFAVSGVGSARLAINGGLGDDRLSGGDENDSFSWLTGDGSDTVDGGAGLDSQSVNLSAASTLTLSAGAGHVLASVNGVQALDLVNVETLTFIGSSGADAIIAAGPLGGLGLSGTGGAGNDTLQGAEGADTLDGGTGDDLLNGGAGNDVLSGQGGAGSDTVDGGAGFDVANIRPGFANATTAITGNADHVVVSILGAQALDLVNVEQINVTGTTGADTVQIGDLSASGVQVFVDGGDGADSLVGSAGAETINGGLGIDQIAGGGGGDSINAGDGDDNIRIAGGNGVDAVDGGAGGDLGFIQASLGVQTISLLDSGGHVALSLNGAAAADIDNIETLNIEGDATQGRIVDIGDLSGTDVRSIIINPAGVLNGQTDLFLLTDSGASEQTDVVSLGSILQTSTGSRSTQILGLEGQDFVTFNLGAGDDTISLANASTASFSVDGQAGNDSITGSAGADQLFGGADADTIVGGGGFDFLDGGEGDDRIQGSGSLFGGAGADSVTGSAGKDNLNGGADADTLDAGSDDDIINGGGGADVIVGGLGKDNITGSIGDDTVDAGAGVDGVSWFFGDGADFIDGGADFDALNLTATFGTIAISGGGGQIFLSDGGSGGTATAVNIEQISILAGGGTVNIGEVAGPNIEIRVEVFDEGSTLGFLGTENGDQFSAAFNEGGTSLRVNNVNTGQAVRVQGLDAFNTAELRFDLGGGADILFFATDFGSGFFAIHVPVIANGGDGDDAIRGDSSLETLNGDAGADTLTTVGGEDVVLNGGAGEDLLVVAARLNSFGAANLDGGAEADVFRFDARLLDLPFQGFNLDLAAGPDGRAALNGLVTVSNVETIQLLANVNSDVIEIGDLSGTGVSQVEVFLGAQSVTEIPDGVHDELILNGAAAGERIFISASNPSGTIIGGLPATITVRDLDSTDTLHISAGGGDDELLLQAFGGRTRVEGGAGNDTLFGGEGFDAFVWTSGDGFDVVDGGGGADSQSLTGGGAGEIISVANAADHLIVSVDGATATDLVNIEFLTINGGGGADVINGGTGGETLAGGAENDTISAGDGSDHIRWSGGDGQDLIDGGDSGDIFFLDGAAGLSIQLSASGAHALARVNGLSVVDLDNVEQVTVSGDAAQAHIYEVGDLSATDVRTVLINIDHVLNGQVDTYILEGGDGADSVGGFQAVDTLQASRGNISTQIFGLESNDVVQFELGAGNDSFSFSGADPARIVVRGGDGFDTLSSGGDVEFEFFFGETGSDVITNYQLNGDVIALVNFADRSFSDLVNRGHLVQSGADVLVNQVGSDGLLHTVVTLQNISVTSLNASDFVFG